MRYATMLLALAAAGIVHGAAAPDPDAIIRRSTAANRADWAASPKFEYTEQVRDDDGARTYAVTMLFGTPYKRLIAVDGHPLPPDKQEEERRKLADERAKRRNESPGDRAKRIAEYQEDRERAHQIIEEMPRAFRYQLRRTQRAEGRTVYVLEATPREGYDPPTVATKILTGMRGEFWIDAASFHWVKATAWTVRAVSIAGLLARVEPGTEFSVEQMPVDQGVWLPRRYQVRSHSRILGLFSHHIDEDHTYSNYRRIEDPEASYSVSRFRLCRPPRADGRPSARGTFVPTG
jgi:hypothetical protein